METSTYSLAMEGLEFGMLAVRVEVLFLNMMDWGHNGVTHTVAGVQWMAAIISLHFLTVEQILLTISRIYADGHSQ